METRARRMIKRKNTGGSLAMVLLICGCWVSSIWGEEFTRVAGNGKVVDDGFSGEGQVAARVALTRIDDKDEGNITLRSPGVWTFAHEVNMGPQVGSGVDGLSIVVDRERNRAFVGTNTLVSVVDLDLNLVTGGISGLSGAQFSLALSEERGELYVWEGGHFLLVFDLNSLEELKRIELESGRDWPSRVQWNRERPILVDEESDRIFMGNRSSVSVIDLVHGSIVKKIELTANSLPPGDFNNLQAITDLIADNGNGKIYAANPDKGLIEVIDAKTLEAENPLDPVSPPVQLILDPEQPFLYAVGYSRLVKFNLTTQASEANVPLRDTLPGDIFFFQTPNPYAIFNEKDRTLWFGEGHRNGLVGSSVSAGVINGDFRPPALFIVDVDQFEAPTPTMTWPMMPAALEIDPESGEVLQLGVDNRLNRIKLDEGALRTDSRNRVIPDAAVEIGGDPQLLNVSEGKNLVYVARGAHGGFFVLDNEGRIVSTAEGPPSLDIVVSDHFDRAYVFEAKDRLGIYELSTLRRLNATELTLNSDFFSTSVSQIQPDPRRGVVWIPSASKLVKLDPVNGRILGEIVLEAWEDGFPAYTDANRLTAYDPVADKLFVVRPGTDGNQILTLDVVDLENERVVSRIDLLKAFDGVSDISWILDMAFDASAERLYMWAMHGSRNEGKGHRILVIDTAREEVVDFVDAPGEAGVGFNVVFDLARRVAYNGRGGFVNLDTGQIGELVSKGDGDIGLNRLTNTIYTVNDTNRKLWVFLGPAGSETPPPVAPAEVEAEAGDEEVTVSWSSVDDPTLIGYNLYRQDRPGAQFVRINPQLITETWSLDTDLTNEQIYSYQVSSVGQGVLESVVFSETASATPEGGGDFRMILLRRALSVAREDSVSAPISLESLEGFGEEIGLTAVGAPEGLEIVFNPDKVVPPKVTELRVIAGANAPLGRFEIDLQGTGGDRAQTARVAVEVTAKELAESVLTLELDREDVVLGIPLVVNGRLFPGLSDIPIQLDFRGARGDTLITSTVDTEVGGGYRLEFDMPFADQWSVTASWTGNDDFAGITSRTVAFRGTSGQSRITATSDLADDADLGWIATLKGRIHPSPGTITVSINVRDPDGIERQIDGVLSTSEGFYGHDLRMDKEGIWEVWASWKGNDQLLGAVSPVITVPVQTDVGRVILLAGGQDSNRDVFWPTSNYLGNLAYTTFQRRRLVKEKIFYLNDRQEQDVDRDGFQEDVDDKATMSAWADAWTWARERVNSDSPLYVYLVGKGQPTGIEIGDGEILTATQLLQDLSALEETTGVQATLSVDASHAGHFIRDLSNQGRHVIASTGLGPAFYQAEGYLSFSQYFLTDLFQGKSVQEAFLHTDQILRNLPGAFRRQDPGLEAEGNLIPNQPGDYLQTLDAIIGAPFELGDLSPQIKASSLSSVAGGAGKQVVTQTRPVFEDPHGPRLKLARSLAEQGVEISARIDDPEGSLAVVRAMIIPPESSEEEELTQYPEVTLEADGTGRWVGVSHEFLEEGVYPVIIYAIDGAGNAAEPFRTTVLVEPPPPLPTGDFSGDGLVDFTDFFLFADAFGSENPAYDLDQSGMVDFGDFFLFADAFGGPLGKLLALAEEMLHLPTEYALGAPYPNPFNSEVVVKYSLPQEGEVELVVYNALGQVVRRLATGHREMGHHRVVWDGRDDAGRGLATGTYLMQLRAGEWRSDAARPADLRFTQVRKVAFVK